MRAFHWILLVAATVLAIFLIVGIRNASPVWRPTQTVGSCLLLVVLAWCIVARLQLGRSFSVKAQARRLVTTGIYRHIRHPIYLASPLLLIGLSLVVAQWWPLLLLAVVVPVQVKRARLEDAVLRAKFADQYEAYRAHTWF
jgi:protein-S-isoprenylcysteine O-methyltransferase Ste14